VIELVATNPLEGSEIRNRNDDFVQYDEGDLDARPFTWQQAKHEGCKHRLGPLAAIKANGTKLAFCEHCNKLDRIRTGPARRVQR
jgi:hypothetical protein